MTSRINPGERRANVSRTCGVNWLGRGVLVALGAMTLAWAGCASAYSRAWRRALTNELSQSLGTEHFDVHWRAGSRAAPLAKWISRSAERELARICARLEVANDTHIPIFLFDDVAELAKTTKVSGTGGFSAHDSAHLIFDDGPARIHELVHLVAYAKVGQAKTMFLAEGLANALLENIKGVDMHAVAKYYRDTKRLPSIVELDRERDFYGWMNQHPKLNAYDIAGSWMRFLIESEGVVKTKRYYVGESPQSVFGKSIEQLETSWLAALDDYKPSDAMALQVVLSDGAPTAKRVRVEGESFSRGIEFELIEKPTFTPKGEMVVKYSAKFVDEEAVEPSGEFQSLVRYAWLKDGMQIEDAGASFKIDTLKTSDAGVYIGVAGIHGDKGEPWPVAAGVTLLDVIPQSEIAGDKQPAGRHM
jgi:hypothetical protein